MKTLIQIYDKDYLKNIRVCMKYDFDHLIVVYKDIDQQAFDYLRNFLYKHVKYLTIDFVGIDEDINEFLKNDEEVIVDVRNGLNYLRFKLYDFSLKNNYPMLINDFDDELSYFGGNKNITLKKVERHLKIADLLELKGGVVGKSNHQSPVLNDETVVENIYKVMDIIFKNNSRHYSEMCALIMAKASLEKNIIDNCSIRIQDFKHLELIRKNACFKAFLDQGLVSLKGDILFFKSPDLFSFIRNAGLILEQYVYTKLKQSNKFDDVDMSVVIQQYHGEKNITNREIDVMVLKDFRLVFISCKLYEVDVKDVMEIKTHDDLYGNYLSKASLIAVNRMECSNNNLYQRSKEMDVYIINQDELENHEVVKEIYDIVNDDYKYDEKDVCLI